MAELRVQRDLKQLASDPISGITVLPMPDNIFEWHVNMVPQDGRLAGIVFHFVLHFPDNYPSSPPKVTPLHDTLSWHPNVYMFGICLDMLDGTRSVPYRGWSSAYTAHSILMQIASFLFTDEAIDQGYGSAVKRNTLYVSVDEVRRKAVSHVCQRCGHCTANPVPPLFVAAIEQPTSPAVEASDTTGEQRSMGSLPVDLQRLIMSQMSAEALIKCIPVSSDAADIRSKSELVCYHTKMPYTEVILGFPVLVNHTGREITAAMDGFVSDIAFDKDYVRTSVWNSPTNAMLPLYLNVQHGTRSIKTVHARVAQILDIDARSVNASHILLVVSRLINGVVVKLVKPASNDTRSDRGISLSMSDAALSGYYHLHHLLVALAVLDSNIIRACTKDVVDFVKYPAARGKNKCPDLGLLLVKLAMTPSVDASWSDFMPPFIRELLARQVRWVEPDGQWFYNPFNEAPEVSELRMKVHFNGAISSVKTVMLQAWFANVARPKDLSSFATQVKPTYDANNGKPPQQLCERFNLHAHNVMACNGWLNFINNLHIGFVPGVNARTAVTQMLQQAVVDSANAKYHRGGPTGYVNATLFNWNDKPMGDTGAVW